MRDPNKPCACCGVRKRAPNQAYCRECAREKSRRYRERLKELPKEERQAKVSQFDHLLCTKCGEKPRRRGQRWCVACHAAHMRATRPKHSELSPEARMKANARSYANEYLRRGKIERGPCEVCGDPGVHMHHDDYSKPLEIRWFCKKHHHGVHGKKPYEE